METNQNEGNLFEEIRHVVKSLLKEHYNDNKILNSMIYVLDSFGEEFEVDVWVEVDFDHKCDYKILGPFYDAGKHTDDQNKSIIKYFSNKMHVDIVIKRILNSDSDINDPIDQQDGAEMFLHKFDYED